MNLQEAKQAGTVSLGNSKMPGSTFAVTTAACKVGSKLAAVEGSTCHKCYAIRIEAFRTNVKDAWTRNLHQAVAMIAADPRAWAVAMAFQIRKAALRTGEPFHRWFDGGDLQSLEMLEAINLTAELTPEISHWLPTREAAVVKAFLAKHGEFSPNLVVRVSSTMIDDKPLSYPNTSTVHKHAAPTGHVCPARQQGNQCGACRACWTATVPNVSYPLH